MPRIVNRQEKETHILLNALKVFARRGFKEATISEIAREAGTGKGTIYEYFRSKEQILEKGFALFFSNLEKHFIGAVKKHTDPAEKLNALFDLLFSELSAFGERFPEVMLDFWAEGIRNKSRDSQPVLDLVHMYRHFRQIIIDILREGMKRNVFQITDPVLEASIILAIVDGLLLQWVMDKNAFTLSQLLEAARDHTFRALKPHK